MYGRITKCFPDRGYAFILGEDEKSYFLHYSNLNDEYIEKGYYVFFVPFQNERSDNNAGQITVINASERYVKRDITTMKKKKRKKHRVHKACNADRVIHDDKKFQKFIRKFMSEQRKSRGERSNNGKTY